MADTPGRTWNDRLAENAYALATVLGIAMVVVGAALAWSDKPESSLIWAGSVIAAVGLVGDRLLRFQVGREGASVEFAERTARIEQAVERAKEDAGAPVLEVPQPSPASLSFPIGANFWTAPAVDRLVTAFGSSSRPEFERAIADFDQMAANGTAVVKLKPERR